MQPSTALQAQSEEQFQRLLESGVLSALFRGQHDGTNRYHDERHGRHDDPNIDDRNSGNHRWDCVDGALLPVADRFGMTKIWVRPSKNPKQKMLFLKYQDLIISAHAVPQYDRPPPFAFHREYIKAPRHGALLLTPMEPQANLQFGPIWSAPDTVTCTPAQLREMVENPDAPLSYWMYTYQRTEARIPRWAVIGRAHQGSQRFFFSKDVMEALGLIHPEESTINLNPDPTTPPTNPFGLPQRDRQEGEGDE